VKLFVYSNMICISWIYRLSSLSTLFFKTEIFRDLIDESCWGLRLELRAQSTALSSRDVNLKMCSFLKSYALFIAVHWNYIILLHIASLTAYGLWLQPGVLNPLFLLASNAEVANMLQPLVMVDRRGKQTNPWCQQDMRKTSRHLLTASRYATLLSTLGSTGQLPGMNFSVAA